MCKGGGAEETTACRGGDAEREFEAYGESIKNVLAFKYLGRVLTAGDDDWLTEVGNLGKARRSWGRLSPVLDREGADPKVSGTFYTAVAQMVLDK